MYQEILHVFRHLRLRAFYLLGGEMDTAVHAVVLAQPQVFVAVHKVLHVLITLFGYGDDGGRLTRYGVAQRTAFHALQACLEIGYGIFQETEQQFDGVGTLQMDVASRMTAFAAAHAHTQCDVAGLGLYRLVAEGGSRVHASCAAYIQLSFRLAVQIQQILAFQPSRFQVVCAVHAGLFVYREECLQGRMNGVLVGKNSHCCCHADAVVCTQSRAVGGHPFAVVLHVCLYRVFLKVEYTVAVLLRHHVHVALQNNARMILHACTRRLADQHIADLVLKGLQTKTLAVIHQELRYLFALAARTRNLCKAVETAPQTFRFQVFHTIIQLILNSQFSIADRDCHFSADVFA